MTPRGEGMWERDSSPSPQGSQRFTGSADSSEDGRWALWVRAVGLGKLAVHEGDSVGRDPAPPGRPVTSSPTRGTLS